MRTPGTIVKCGERVGIRLWVETMDHAPAVLTWRELWVLSVLAENANDTTRLCWPGYDGDSERSHRFRARVRCSRTQFYSTLASLADKGVLETVERGHNGRNATYRLLPLARPGASSVPETGTLEASRFTGPYDGAKGPGFEEVASRFEGSSVPVYGTPIPQSPQISSSLSTEAELVRTAKIVEPGQERDFTDWIIKTRNPATPGWWRTVIGNGDIVVLAAAWRATAASPRPVAAVLSECADCRVPIRGPLADDGLCADCRAFKIAEPFLAGVPADERKKAEAQARAEGLTSVRGVKTRAVELLYASYPDADPDWPPPEATP